MAEPDIIAYGDAAILVRFKTEGYSQDTVEQIFNLERELTRLSFWDDIVPGYDNLLVTFNPVKIDLNKAKIWITEALAHIKPQSVTGKTISVPVLYGDEWGPDIDTISKSSGLSNDEVISLHSSHTYTVCMLGFIPGFVFLSQAPEPLHHPRHSTPRQLVPSGSVGIAGWQTGIYGLNSPGGWQIIGRTPLKTFNAKTSDPFPIKAGDKIKFTPVTEAHFDD